MQNKELNNTVDNKIDEEFDKMWESIYADYDYEHCNIQIKIFIHKAIKQREEEIIKVLSKEYNRALKENEFGESNAYAHSIAIVRKF